MFERTDKVATNNDALIRGAINSKEFIEVYNKNEGNVVAIAEHFGISVYNTHKKIEVLKNIGHKFANKRSSAKRDKVGADILLSLAALCEE